MTIDRRRNGAAVPGLGGPGAPGPDRSGATTGGSVLSADVVEARLAERLAGAGPGQAVGVVVVALDGADAVADALGLRQLDELAVAVVGRWRDQLRLDDFVLRIDRSRWAVVACPLRGWRDLELLADRLVNVARELNPLPLAGHRMTASAGLALALDVGARPDWLLAEAERGARTASATGGNRWLRGSEVAPWGAARLARLGDVRRAIDDNELEVALQPVVARSGTEGDTAWFEALISWRPPDHGRRYPATYLDDILRAGLARPYVESVVTLACRSALERSVAGHRAVTVSLDLPLALVAQMERIGDDLAGLALGVVGRVRVEPGQLGFEVDLAELRDADQSTRAALARVAALGIRLVVDGVGLTLADLGWLAAWSVADAWKLAPDLAAGLEQADSAGVLGDPVRAQVRAAVAMAATRGVELVATGVDGAEVARHLAGAGVGWLQGLEIGRSVTTTR